MYYDNFKALCEAKGIRPADISKATGITSATFSSWKNGAYTPKQEKLQQIVDFFGVPLSALTGDSEVFELLIVKDLNKFNEGFEKLDREDRQVILTMIDSLLSRDKYKKDNVQDSEVG